MSARYVTGSNQNPRSCTATSLPKRRCRSLRIAGKVDLQDRTGASQVRLIICRWFTHWIADAITSQLRWTAVWVALYSSKNGRTRHKHAAFSILSCAAPLETKPSGLDTATELTCLLLSSSSSYGSLDRGSGVLFDSTITTVAENTRMGR